MYKIALAAGLAALLLLASAPGNAKSPAASKNNSGAIVIVFKDGHRQSFNLTDIERIEFPGSTASAAVAPHGDEAARGQFVGRWVVGVGSGSDSTFVITLKDNGNAMRSLHELHGTWSYVNGEARITWDDGAKDAIRKVGSGFQKYAYRAGKSFSDEPDNVTRAENTTPKPI